MVNRLAREGNLQAAKLMLDRFSPQAAVPDGLAPDTFRALAQLALSSRPEATEDDDLS